MKYPTHNISTGQFLDGKLYEGKEVGYSFIREEDGFYTVKLNMFPVHSYFLVKNKSNDHYTVYSKILRSENSVKFIRPVGFAKLLQDNKDLMFIKFHMPKMTMYMDLYAA